MNVAALHTILVVTSLQNEKEITIHQLVGSKPDYQSVAHQ